MIMTRPLRRWSGNDSHLGPFTWCGSDWKKWGLIVDSGGDDEGNTGCHARMYLGKMTVLVELPNWIPNFRIKHSAKTWDAATIARLGRDYYFETFPREFGFSFTMDGALHTYFGPQTHDSTTTKGKVFFLPWANWRFIGKKWYGLRGELLRTGGHKFDDDYKFQQLIPKACFEFDDYDGKRITASTHIEEREWRFGTGGFKWLSIFRRPKIHRSLAINFSEEVGPEKGSWKGGTLGHSIDMLPGELHEAAFRRYCEQEHRSKHRTFRLKYVAPVAETA